MNVIEVMLSQKLLQGTVQKHGVECQLGNDATNRRVIRCRHKEAGEDVYKTLGGKPQGTLM